MLRRLPWWLLAVVLVLGLEQTVVAGAKAPRRTTRTASKTSAYQRSPRRPRPTKTVNRLHQKTTSKLRHRATRSLRSSEQRFQAKQKPRTRLNQAPKPSTKAAKARPNQRAKVRRTGTKSNSVFARAKAQLWPRVRFVAFKARAVIRYVGAHVTVATDHVEARLPAKWRPTFRKMRLVSPASFLAFVMDRAFKDPVFLLTYNLASYGISKASGPILVSMGVSPVLSFFAGFATLPIDISVLLLRERHLRRKTQPNLTLAQTAIDVLHEFRQFAIHRRARGRAMLGRPGYPFGSTPGAWFSRR